MPICSAAVALLLAAGPDPCLPGAKVVKRDNVEQCVTAQGKLHGLVRVKSSAGKVILEQRWENDVQEGPGRTWHDNGKLASETSHRRGKPHGRWKEWWGSGLLETDSEWRDGVRTGTWMVLYEDGRPGWTRTYGAAGALKSETLNELGQQKAFKGPGLPKEIIARIIRAHRAPVRLCYEEQLQRNPALAGKVRVDFEIALDGSVKGAALHESTLKSPAVEKCVLDRVQKMEFPRPLGGETVSVSFPFTFKGVPEEEPPVE